METNCFPCDPWEILWMVPWNYWYPHTGMTWRSYYMGTSSHFTLAKWSSNEDEDEPPNSRNTSSKNLHHISNCRGHFMSCCPHVSQNPKTPKNLVLQLLNFSSLGGLEELSIVLLLPHRHHRAPKKAAPERRHIDAAKNAEGETSGPFKRRWLSTFKGRNKHREVVDVLGLPMVFASQNKWFHQQERFVERNWRVEYVNATKKGDFTSKNQDNFNSNQLELFKIYMWYVIGFFWLLPQKNRIYGGHSFTNELVNINQQTELSGVHVVRSFRPSIFF